MERRTLKRTVSVLRALLIHCGLARSSLLVASSSKLRCSVFQFNENFFKEKLGRPASLLLKPGNELRMNWVIEVSSSGSCDSDIPSKDQLLFLHIRRVVEWKNTPVVICHDFSTCKKIPPKGHLDGATNSEKTACIYNSLISTPKPAPPINRIPLHCQLQFACCTPFTKILGSHPFPVV